ncbi:MAG: ATP-binding cassette domain-containing protein [Rhodospirillales bacterium]|nr:ATP-binding cassette domain-containing protein [Rhodospirillales bacterium]
MIVLSGLTKRFGPLTAVDGVSFSVDRGEVLGFLGPNGSGKTTTMRMITGYLSPSAGSVVVCGHDVAAEPLAAQRRIGYLPEGAPLYGDMQTGAFLNFVASVRGMSGADKAHRVGSIVERVEIGSVLHQPIDTLSKGFKRRVGLAQALLHDPEILILDEPTDGLDPNQKHQVRNLIRDMGHDKAIIISTHILEEMDAVCTRAAVIAKGRMVFDGTPNELEQRSAFHNSVSIRVKSELASKLGADIGNVAGVARVEAGETVDGVTTILVIPADGRSIVRDVSERVGKSGFTIEEIHAERGRFDEVFRQLTASQ